MVQIEIGERSFVPRAGASLPVNPAAPAAQRLVSGGAIMTLPGPGGGQHLVGYLEWLGPRRLFWFTAYGESLADAHLLEFESLHVIAERGVYFSAGGNLIASLTTLDHANVDDPDDYRIAWQLWQEVAPLRRRIIEECCVTLATESPLVDGIDGQPWTRAATLSNGKARPRA